MGNFIKDALLINNTLACISTSSISFSIFPFLKILVTSIFFVYAEKNKKEECSNGRTKNAL